MIELVRTPMISVAPMMDWTDRHDRVFLRQISRSARLYTEMVPAGAILHGDRARFLAHDPCEHPLALQVGGAEPADLATCAAIAQDYGFDEINLNVGCPSDRVQKGRFGACLMAEPDLVAACVKAMIGAASIPVTVKTRIGIDDRDSFEELCDFARKVRDAGLTRLIVHARKAWLSGLSPKQNREVPPLRHDVVYRLKETFPELEIVLNGGVQTLDEADAHLRHVDGVMLGRAAYQDSYVLAEVDRRFYGDARAVPDRADILRGYLSYVAVQVEAGVPLACMTRHILGLYNGLPGARAWRRHLSLAARRPGAGPAVIEEAMALVRRAQEARRAA
jgi:tRNA-dihydrouridine synthase A